MSEGYVQGTAAAVPGSSTRNWRVQAQLALPGAHQVGEPVSGTVQCFLLCRMATEMGEGRWAEGVTAICKVFVWPNYCKSPYVLNWQGKECCCTPREMMRVPFSSSPLLISQRAKNLERGSSKTRPRQ